MYGQNDYSFNPYQYYVPQPQQTYFPQQQQMNNFQQNPNFQSQKIPGGIPGKIISNPGEIAPNEVAMDGSMCIFPLSDYSTIYAKQWTQDGKIRTIEFVPRISTDETTHTSNDDLIAYFDKKFDELKESLSKEPKTVMRKPTPKTN